jgi:hypothetical protein
MPTVVQLSRAAAAMAMLGCCCACADGRGSNFTQAPIFFGAASRASAPASNPGTVVNPSNAGYVALGGDALLPAAAPAPALTLPTVTATVQTPGAAPLVAANVGPGGVTVSINPSPTLAPVNATLDTAGVLLGDAGPVGAGATTALIAPVGGLVATGATTAHRGACTLHIGC